MLQQSDMPPQRNALVLPDLLNLDLRNESRGGRCRATSRVAEDKENVNPNSLRLQKQRRLAKARAAKKAAVPSAPEAATAPTAELSAPAASSAPAPKVEPRALHVSHNALNEQHRVAASGRDPGASHAFHEPYERRAHRLEPPRRICLRR